MDRNVAGNPAVCLADTVVAFQCGEEFVTRKRVVGAGNPIPVSGRNGRDIADDG
jgi:hypothetical protein